MTDDLFDIVGDAPASGSGSATTTAGDPPVPPDLILRLHVHPGAGRTAVVGRHGDALKVKVAAPPADGRANAACVTLVADLLGIAATQVEIAGGAGSRSKRVRVRGVQGADMRRTLDAAMANGNAGPARGVRSAAR
jgi:uncharacterized protein (TIGR00251 family)